MILAERQSGASAAPAINILKVCGRPDWNPLYCGVFVVTLCVSVHAHAHVQMPQHEHRGQETTCRGRFSHLMGPGDLTQAVRLGDKWLSLAEPPSWPSNTSSADSSIRLLSPPGDLSL